jgi:hypothetical protein
MPRCALRYNLEVHSLKLKKLLRFHAGFGTCK